MPTTTPTTTTPGKLLYTLPFPTSTFISSTKTSQAISGIQFDIETSMVPAQPGSETKFERKKRV